MWSHHLFQSYIIFKYVSKEKNTITILSFVLGVMRSRWQRKAVITLLILGLLLPFGIKADDDNDEEAGVTEEQTVSC